MSAITIPRGAALARWYPRASVDGNGMLRLATDGWFPFTETASAASPSVGQAVPPLQR